MQSLADTLEEYKKLEDKRIHRYLDSHNHFIREIEKIDIDQSGSHQIAKVEYLYSKAQLYASLIAGHYRKLQRYHEAMAEQEQANEYEKTRRGENGEYKSGTDGQYLSRRAKGKELEKAATYEGDYIRWRGIAESYENSINSLKDIIKSLEKENRGGV